jgi:hypothetical protein
MDRSAHLIMLLSGKKALGQTTMTSDGSAKSEIKFYANPPSEEEKEVARKVSAEQWTARVSLDDKRASARLLADKKPKPCFSRASNRNVGEFGCSEAFTKSGRTLRLNTVSM